MSFFSPRPGYNTSIEASLLTALNNLAVGGVGTAIQKTTATTFTNVMVASSTGTVTSVATDSTLTGGPITTTGTLGLNLANANTWTGKQTFNTTAPTFGTITIGSILYAGTSGLLSQDNANLFWDGTNHRLGIGTAAPTHPLTIGSTSAASTAWYDTTDQVTNYDRLVIVQPSISGNGLWSFITQAGGTGTTHGIEFDAPAAQLRLGGSGNSDNAGFDFISQQSGATSNVVRINGVVGGSGASSGVNNMMILMANVTQTGTAGYNGIYMPVFENTIGSGARMLIDLGTSTLINGGGVYTSKFNVSSVGNGYFAGTLNVVGHLTLEGVTSTGATGTGALVFANSPTLVTAVLGSSTATTQTPADNSTKVATTAYVDAAVLGQNFKEAALVATTANLVGVYVSGVFTYTATGTDNIDGVNLALGNRVLVKNQTTTFQNGIYTVTTAGSLGVAGVLTRASDANTSGEFKTGDSIFVTSGTINTSTTWAYTGSDSPNIGTDAITYAQTAGQGTVTAGNGITITGLSVAIDTSVTVDKTTAQTLTNKTLTNNNYNALFDTNGNEIVSFVAATSAVNYLQVGNSASAGGFVTLNATGGSTNVNLVLNTKGTGMVQANGINIVDVSTAQTLTNKTLTAPTLTTPNVGVATGTNVILTANAITATSNAATIPVTSGRNIVTNNSAATLTITLATSGAVNMQTCMVQILDFSAVAQTLTFVNTENSSISVPTTSNGSATLPTTVGFIYNNATSKWRCIAVA